MTPFRGDDETLDREIATLEGMAKRRVRRYASELRSLDQDLRDLRRERARRRSAAEVLSAGASETYEDAPVGE